MVNTDNIRSTVVKGIREYVGCPFVRNNQTAKMPDFPFLGYTITTPATENKGTYGIHDDGTARKPVKQIWSITSHSDNYEEAVNNANKARTWLDYAGYVYLSDNGVTVETVGAVSDRSNLLTADYQYSYGFDCTFFTMDEIVISDEEVIESVEFSGINVDTPPTAE